MQAEQIAKALGNAKKVNGSWLASCPLPTHGQGNGDKNPSLSITDGQDGKPLFKCHGGCEQHDVFAAIRDYGLLPDLEPRAELLASIQPLPQQQQSLEQEWHYTDEDGVTLFIKQRYKTNDAKGKTYKQLRVDESGKRHQTITGAKIVPYNLPEVEDARKAGRTVFLTEGEKAADALKSIGVIATCTHQGASSFPEDAIQYFAGLNVVILPDNDKVGWEYARKAVKAIKTVANSIRVLDLQLEEAKEDAYEYVHDYAGTKQHLSDYVKNYSQRVTIEGDVTIPERFMQQEEKATEQPELELQPSTNLRQPFKIEQLDDIDDEPVEWLIEGVIPKKAFVALYAPPASFKSFIALDIAECIATGREFLTKQVKHEGAVLYIAGEGHGGIGARIKAMKKHHNTPAGAPVFFLRKQINLRSSATDIQDLIQAVDEIQATQDIKFELVVIDTLARAFGGGNENASEDMGAFITAAGAIQGRYNCALLVVHHAGKDATKGLRGHSSLLGAVDTELEIIRIEDAPKGILHISKQKDGEDGQRYGFQMVEVELSTTLLGFDSISSLAVEVDGDMDVNRGRKEASAPPDRTGGGRNQTLALSCLHSAIKKFGMMENIDGKRNKCIKLDQWKDEFKAKMGSDVEASTFNKAWARVKSGLIDLEKVEVHNDWCWAVFAEHDGSGTVIPFGK
jgi:hypothetical protein